MNNENPVNDLNQQKEANQERLENEKVLREYELQKEVEADEEEEDRRYIIIFFIIALLLLIFIVIGFAYSIFGEAIKGPSQPISAQVVFNYSDKADENSGIHITNASAMSDASGKMLMGEKNTFDFSISGKNNSKMDVKYYIVLEEDESSTLDPSNVKVYLTSRKGNVEEELFQDVPIITSLKELEVEGINYRVLYEKVLPSKEKFLDEYTLRMWIKEDATDYYSKDYSLRVNVYTEGVGV